MQLSPYLHFKGQCEEAFKFYEKALNGKLDFLMAFEKSPMANQVPADWQNKVMHATLTAGGVRVMGSDPPPDRYQKPQGFSMAVNLKDAAEADRVFKALAEGGAELMPIQETFWALRYGMLVDRYGIPWMVNCEKPMP